MGAPGPRRGAGGLVVARPSLKRVVPGSVPPWRALCAESARALKAFFQFSVFPASFLLGRGGGAPPQLQWPSGRASVSEAGGRSFGLPQRCLWPRRGFPFPAITKARQPFVISTLDPLSEHFCGRNALGFARRRTSKLVGVLHLS